MSWDNQISYIMTIKFKLACKIGLSLRSKEHKSLIIDLWLAREVGTFQTVCPTVLVFASNPPMRILMGISPYKVTTIRSPVLVFCNNSSFGPEQGPVS